MVQQAPLGSEVRDGVRAKAWLPLASMLSGANHGGGSMHGLSGRVTYQGSTPNPALCLRGRGPPETWGQIWSVVSWRRWDQTAAWQVRVVRKPGQERRSRGEQTRSQCYTSCGVTFPSYMALSRAVMLLQDYRSGQRAS